MPLTSTNKNIKFRVKGVTTGGTAIGTATESIIDINFAYLTAQAASTGIALMANTSHSYNSWTSAEPGYVLLYVRCSCDATNAFIDIYKYKSVVVEMTCYPMMESDWTFATGTLTANPTVGSVRTAQTDLRTGMTSNGGYVSESAYSGYSTYGVLGGNTG